jgi:hypothetical protein
MTNKFSPAEQHVVGENTQQRRAKIRLRHPLILSHRANREKEKRSTPQSSYLLNSYLFDN